MYPTVQDLARSDTASVLRVWKGMGYNRRALYLHRMAQIIADTYNGIFPDSEGLLVKLPGLGTYTARALLVFAFRKDVACVDTNIRKIITHYFFNDKHQSSTIIQSTADLLVPKGKSWEWHQALMDYGSAHTKELRIRNYELGIKKIPFKKTNRFIRGRIIDLLREQRYPMSQLITKLISLHGRDKEYYDMCLTGLEADGLVKREKNTVSLP